MNSRTLVNSLAAALIVAAATAMGEPVTITEKHTVEIDDGTPSVVREAARREAERQDKTWTSENIQKNPYLFLCDCVAKCDQLKSKVEAQNITLVRMEKEATRKIDDATSLIARYTKFLALAKVAYKAAEENGKWPVDVGGSEMDEEELSDKIADALDRIELAEKEKKTNEGILKKVAIRKGVLKTKKRELVTRRREFSQQAEQVKMNAELAEISALQDIVGTMKDLMLDIEDDPSKLSLEDLTAEDPNAARNGKVKDFLNKK